MNYRDSKDIPCHSYVLGEGKNAGRFGHQEYIVVKHSFSKYCMEHQWDVKVKSWKVHSLPTHPKDLEE